MAVSMSCVCDGVKNGATAVYNRAAGHVEWYINTFVMSTKGRDDLVACLEKTCEVVSAFLSLAPSVADVGKAAGDFGKAATVLRGAGSLFGFPMTIRDAYRAWLGFFNNKSFVNQLSAEQKVFYLANITTTAVYMSFMCVFVFANLAKKTQLMANMSKASPWIKLTMSGSSVLYSSTNLISEKNTMNLLRMEAQAKCNPLLSEEQKCVMVEEAMLELRMSGKLEQKLSDARTVQAMKLTKDILEIISITVGFSKMPYARQIKASFAFCSGGLGVAADLFKSAREMESKKKENERGLAEAQNGVKSNWLHKDTYQIQQDSAYQKLKDKPGQQQAAIKAHAEALDSLERKGISINLISPEPPEDHNSLF